MFSFDLPESVAPQTPSDDPFNFDEEPAAPAGGDFSFNDENKGMQTKAEEDAFADLLETTPQKESAVEGSSDLNNFSWDDTPGTSAANPAKPAEDGFDSLFGDTDDSAEK
jgi:hypothetical protein